MLIATELLLSDLETLRNTLQAYIEEEEQELFPWNQEEEEN